MSSQTHFQNNIIHLRDFNACLLNQFLKPNSQLCLLFVYPVFMQTFIFLYNLRIIGHTTPIKLLLNVTACEGHIKTQSKNKIICTVRAASSPTGSVSLFHWITALRASEKTMWFINYWLPSFHCSCWFLCLNHPPAPLFSCYNIPGFR